MDIASQPPIRSSSSVASYASFSNGLSRPAITSEIATSTRILNPEGFGQYSESTTVVLKKKQRTCSFFTPRKKIVEKGKNFVRTVGKNDSKWHGDGRCNEFKVGNFH
ncbi:hypothetical protein LINPERPRIM_LOCUS26833 [Linum perenne]